MTDQVYVTPAVANHMCDFGCRCCQTIRKNVMRWAGATTFAALILVGATVWGTQKLIRVGDNVECIIDGYKNLKALVSSFNLTAGGDAANAIDESIIDNIETGLKDRDLRFYGPVRACVCVACGEHHS